MCISAEADVVAGLLAGAAGLDGLRHVRRPAERWLAAIPLVLGVHQLVEAPIWLGLEDQLSEAVWRPAVLVYLAIAFGALPVLVPASLKAVEPSATRLPFTHLGIAVALVLMHAVVRGPVEARDEGRQIDYTVDLWQGGLTVAFYLVATCGPLLTSRYRHVRWFGAANLVVAGLLAWANESGFISLWCFWAAITSVAIAAHLRLAPRSPVEAPARA